MSIVNRHGGGGGGGGGRPQRNVSNPARGGTDAVLKNVRTCSAAQQTSYSKFTLVYSLGGEEAGA